MAISKKTLYGISALYYLSKKDSSPTSIQEISENCLIPKKFLEHILIELKKFDFLKSIRGNKGGYILNKSPSEIYVFDVIQVLDKDFCMVYDDDFDDKVVKKLFEMTNDSIKKSFYISFEDLKQFDGDESYMYVI